MRRAAAAAAVCACVYRPLSRQHRNNAPPYILDTSSLAPSYLFHFLLLLFLPLFTHSLPSFPSSTYSISCPRPRTHRLSFCYKPMLLSSLASTTPTPPPPPTHIRVRACVCVHSYMAQHNMTTQPSPNSILNSIPSHRIIMLR